MRRWLIVLLILVLWAIVAVNSNWGAERALVERLDQ